MASAVDNNMSQTDRRTRLDAFDRAPSMQTPLGFGTGFGPTKSAWNSNGNIWGNGNHSTLFKDGAADAGGPNGSTSHITDEESYPRGGKIGSGSLLDSSESESWTDRLNTPWSIAKNGASAALSRPQTSAVSPARFRNEEKPTSTINPLGNSRDPSSCFPSHQSQPFFPTKQAPQIASRHFTAEPRHQSSKPNTFPCLPNDPFDEDQRQDINSMGFRANASINSTQPRIRTFDGSTDGYSLETGISQPNGFSTPGPSNFDSSEFYPRPSRSHDHNQYNHNSLLHHPQRHRDQPIYSYSNTQDRSRYDGQEDQLSTALSRMNLQLEDMPQEDGSSFRSQRIPQRASYNSYASLGPSPPRSSNSNSEFALMGQYPQGGNVMNDSSRPFPSDHYRSTSFAEQGPSSPSANDYRRGFNSPFYSTSGTPPTGTESVRSASGSGFSSHTSNGQLPPLDRRARGSLPFQPEQQYLSSNPLQARMQYNQQFEYPGYAGSLRLNPLANPYAMPSSNGILTTPYPSRYPSREHDPSQIIRSPVLEDFRTNHKTNKKYELKDIYNHVVEFSGDQHGSRFIQQKLETANSDEKDQIFAEIQPNSLQLMTDVFGNYVIQKLFEHGNQAQKKILANQMRGHVMTLSTQMYGCRVVQKALEHILTDQQASMVKELEPHVLKCVKDQNGNHVIQKAIERVPAEHIQFIINAFTDQVQRLAMHPYGCRVIQRMLEHCQEPSRQSILRELHACVSTLITDQFGNYVIQHVIENGDEKDKARIVSIVTTNLLVFSKHKFASNVVEKSIECAEDSQRAEILRLLTVPNEKGESPVLGLMRDQYGNYVIQKVLGQLKGAERENLVNQIKPQLMHLKKFSYGKQIIAIEKLIFDGDTDPNLSASSQSSALPSTNASTVEGPVTSPHVQIMKPTFTIDPPTAGPSTSV